MLGTILLLIFSCSKSIVSSFEFTDDNSFLLNCPINSGDDYQNLLNMAESDSHKIDIFQEIVSVESVSMVQLLADEETSDILLGRFGCFEEKGRGHLKNMFNPRNNFDYKLGKEFHQDYRSYQNIIDQLFQYSNSYPSYVKALKSIGKSNEGRDLFVIHITDPSNRIGTKPLIWIMAGQHAREWIAPASTMLFIDELLLSSSSQNILKNFEFAVMPLVNPDGYEYSRNTNRLWRKNRNRNGGSGGGVDLNRNWDHRWGEMGTSKYPDSVIYCGPSPASEPEVSHTQRYILSLKNRIIGFDIHSYSQLILRNYAWTNESAPNESMTSEISKIMSDSIRNVNGKHYNPIKSSHLYFVTGSADDWLYVKAGIPGFVIELRDTGRFGFLLPSDQIVPTGMELFAGIISAVKTCEKIK